jgi:O-antigen/teichoic acid export membrane protein
MLATDAESGPVPPTTDRSTFFRQSGWLMIANIGGGMLMWLVHFLNKIIPDTEYGVFGFLLTAVMLVPQMPIQMVFAQQTAKALAMNKTAELSGFIRRAWLGTLVVWVLGVGALFVFQGWVMHRENLTNPAGLWITMVAIILQVWMPLLWGVLQGQQNFVWLGWSMISSGVGRLTCATIAVLLIHKWAAQDWYAPGMIIGVVAGLTLATIIGAWHTRSIWLLRPAPFDWGALARQVIPVLLTFFGFQVLFTADTLFVQAYFPKDTEFYVSAGTLSRALMWLVGPLAAVMFPRLVHSAAKGEKQNLTGLVLTGTVILAGVGAVGLALVGPLVVKIVYKQAFVHVAASLLPWYAAAMIPLSAANVLLNDLLAKPSSKAALGAAVFALCIAYAVTLSQYHPSLVRILQIVCVFNLLLLGISAYFTWQAKKAA